MRALEIQTAEGAALELVQGEDAVTVNLEDPRGARAVCLLRQDRVKDVIRFLVDYLAALEAGGLRVWE